MPLNPRYYRQTVHGFRGLTSTWANEAECYKSDWIEVALAHADEDVVRGDACFRAGGGRSRVLCLFLRRRISIAELPTFTPCLV